jgi:lipopolysaccharide export system protein LptA
MARFASAVLVLIAFVVVGHAASAVVDVSAQARGLAVAPFDALPSTDGDELPDVANLLATEIASRSHARVVAPDRLRHDERGIRDPRARDVRRWALWNQVENVIVGRTSWRHAKGLDVAVELRSGHSGAARAEYRLEPASVEDLPSAVTRLATLILADIGEPTGDGLEHVGAAGPAGSEGPDAVPESPQPAPQQPEPVEPDDGSLELLPGVDRDDPIAINSEELEVLTQDGGRKLVFSRNVEVLQGDVTLNADRLEAIYPEGSSQPDRLVATGHVRVAQGDRRARCEDATYVRVGRVIVCRGRAEVTQGCDRVRGETIEFDLDRERVRVKGAASVVIQPDSADDGACLEEGSAGARRP